MMIDLFPVVAGIFFTFIWVGSTISITITTTTIKITITLTITILYHPGVGPPACFETPLSATTWGSSWRETGQYCHLENQHHHYHRHGSLSIMHQKVPNDQNQDHYHDHNHNDDHNNHNDDHNDHHYQITYDVVTEEQCATHSVPECATVVRQVPEQVRIVFIVIVIIIVLSFHS